MDSHSGTKKLKSDALLEQIADYVVDSDTFSEEAYVTARACLADSLGCAVLALGFPACTKLLGPVVEGTVVPKGARVPGTEYVLDPVCAAFNIGTMIRWLDYNDTWLAAEWGHPSDNLGGLLAVSDFLCQRGRRLSVRDLLNAMIKAHEIQGGLAMQNSFNKIGMDHVILVKIATTAVTTFLLGGTKEQVADALSNAFIDLGPLRTYRHAPNTGSRKSWAAGDATARGVQMAMMTMRGEMGYPSALTAKRWGFYDVLFGGEPMHLEMPLSSYVMEHVLFKVSFPAEFHGQTAVEAAIELHPLVKDRLEDIASIEIETQESAMRIIDKKGPLNNPADRDHCIQYMTAVGLIYGDLRADHYEKETAEDPRIDFLRDKMHLRENKQYSCDYLDPDKRSIANAVTIHFSDGSKGGPVAVEYPIGHRRRRKEGLPLLYDKCRENLTGYFGDNMGKELLALLQGEELLDMEVSAFLESFIL